MASTAPQAKVPRRFLEGVKFSIYLVVPIMTFAFVMYPGKLDDLIQRYRYVSYPPEHQFWQRQRQVDYEKGQKALMAAKERQEQMARQKQQQQQKQQ